MARLAGVNVPSNKRLVIALSYIFGIGKKFSNDICASVSIDRNKRVSSLTEEEIIKIRELILKEILKLLEKYALENSVDLILDSTSYLIASNSLDITIDINSKLEKLNLNLEYKDFEKN